MIYIYKCLTPFNWLHEMIKTKSYKHYVTASISQLATTYCFSWRLRSSYWTANFGLVLMCLIWMIIWYVMYEDVNNTSCIVLTTSIIQTPPNESNRNKVVFVFHHRMLVLYYLRLSCNIEEVEIWIRIIRRNNE